MSILWRQLRGNWPANRSPKFSRVFLITKPRLDLNFRIQIKNSAGAIVYDNGADPDFETILASGNIQVHKCQ